MPLKKLCSRTGCKVIVNYNVVYCPAHQEEWEAKEKERYKEYSKRRRKDREQKKYQSFYSSHAWKKVREFIVNHFYGIDILEYYRTGRIVQGERVHHIVCLEDDWNMRLETENLICLTERNHRRVHAEYDKDDKSKAKMQNILLELIKRWNKEFGG